MIPHSYSIPDELNRLSRIFVIVNVEISIIVGPSLSRLGKLEAEAVIAIRVCPEDSAIVREGLVRGLGLADGARPDAIPNAAGGEGGHGAATTHR